MKVELWRSWGLGFRGFGFRAQGFGLLPSLGVFKQVCVFRGLQGLETLRFSGVALGAFKFMGLSK